MAELNVDSFLKPDKTLATLEKQLRTAKEDEVAAIQKQIDERQAELTAQFGSVGFGSGGYVIPNYAYSEESGAEYGDLLTKQNATQAALAGKMQLIPTATNYTDPVTGTTTNLNPIYQAQYYGPQGQTGWMKDPVTGEIYDPMDPVRMNKAIYASINGTADPKSLRKTFYDENGRELTPEEVAKTAQGLGFAKAGWDIGFGAGMLNGVDVNKIFKEQGNDGLRDYIVNNLAASGELRIPGYDPITGTVTSTNGSTTNTSTTNTSTKNNSSTNTNASNKTLVSTQIDDSTGDTVGYFSDGSKMVLNKGTGPVQSAEFKDAYALLTQTFRDYGLESLVPAIEGFMKRNLGANQAAVELRTMPEYIARFKGNDLRRASGKNALTEAEYLAIEDAYDQTLRAYGQQNYFGINRKTKQEKAAELIGNDISAIEFRDRIQLAIDRVQNADPVIKDTLKRFYPGLNESDLVGYFLNPADNLPKLKEKVTASEIGAAAAGFNLGTDVTAATDLAKYGVTQAQAREGYSTIAGLLPTTSKLGDIYNETGVKYAQKEAEAEVFKSNQDAATKRKRLASMERAAFSGSSGTGQSSLSKSTQGLL